MVNAEPAFTGHQVCDSDNWINAITNPGLSGIESGEIVGGGSFHPDPAGQQEFATLINECLASDIPTGDLVSGDGTCGEVTPSASLRANSYSVGKFVS
jgi:hypothetical protein